jgi:hypothetical protein
VQPEEVGNGLQALLARSRAFDISAGFVPDQRPSSMTRA